MLVRIALLVALALSFFIEPATAARFQPQQFNTQQFRAQEYVSPTWPSLLRTMIRFGAIDITSDPFLLDEYAVATECELYEAFYPNDFKWQQVRRALKESIQKNVATYPVAYYHTSKVQLGRYDFDQKLFRFTKKTTLKGVNAIYVYAVSGLGCGVAETKFLPRSFRAVLSSVLYLEGLPLPERDARALVARMEEDGNKDRIIYVRFNVHIVYIEPFMKIEDPADSANVHYSQPSSHVSKEVRLDARLDSIVFYEDKKMTKSIYTYAP